MATSTNQQRSVAGGVALGLLISAVIHLFLMMFGITAVNLVGVVATIAFLAMCGCLLVVLDEVAALRQVINRREPDSASVSSDKRNGRTRSREGRAENAAAGTSPAAAQTNSPRPSAVLTDDSGTDDIDDIWDE
ncbi:MAG: hypothetical protein R3C49_04020 [Planctomycetaceae bacterium]